MTFNSPAEALTQVWGYNRFRPLQLKIIQSVLEGKDTLTLLPTGGGKSLCYQVPALCLQGICLVVSPLIALMKDQVDELSKLGLKAYAIYSGQTHREIDIILDNCVYGETKFLYVSPERLHSDLFRERVKKMNVSILAVDEAHCISQWGHDFRPSYLEINEFRQIVPEAKLIALTATATERVVHDILLNLAFAKDHKTFIQSFSRPNLSLNVRKVEDKDRKLLEIMGKTKGQSIVYARTRKKTREIAALLIRHGISADFYHGGLEQQDRIGKQEAWMKNKFRVMVATNAFGMGINKPDVRLVVHMDLTSDLESYYQEAGRAGRDGQKSYAIIIYHPYDLEELHERIKMSSPDVELMRRVYQSLANYFKLAVGSSSLTSFDFDLGDFVKTYQYDYLAAFHALKKLGEQGFIQLTDSFYQPSKVYFLPEPLELYKFQVANKTYEPVTKALLRLHGGELYTNFVTISERKIAFSLKTTVADIERKLSLLHDMEILVYDQQKEKPQITFTTPRFDASKLPLDTKLVEARKRIDLENMRAVIDYVSQDSDCRSNIIQEYFGEEKISPCGHCDVCIAKGIKRNFGKSRLEIMNHLKTIIAEGPIRIADILPHFPPHSENEVMTILRELLESEEIFFDELKMLSSN